MNAVVTLTGAWGDDPAHKQASLATARAALAAAPAVNAMPLLRMATDGYFLGNVYCVAYGTVERSELEARSGLPTATLMLASSALCGCQYQIATDDQGHLGPRLVDSAIEATIAALEAIPVGTDPLALARCYVSDLLDRLADLRDRDDRGLTPEHQSLVRQLKCEHVKGRADPATFRAFRRAMMTASDHVGSDIEMTVLQFAESAAWPLPGLIEELPALVAKLHSSLRVLQTFESPSHADQSVQDALSAPTLLAQMAKLCAMELNQKVTSMTMQVLGMHSQAHPLTSVHETYSQAYLRSVANTIEGGTSEIQRNVIATRGLGMPRG